MKGRTGRCLCGSVRFSAQEVQDHFNVCHCGMCRRWGGPLFSAHASGVSFEGLQHITRYRSSDWAERGFCSKCGTHLFYFFAPKSAYFIAIGVFDEPHAFTLRQEIFVDQKPDNYDLAGDHPRLTEAQTLAQYQQS